MEKQIQIKNEQNMQLYAAIDVDTKAVLHDSRGTRDPAEELLKELKEKHRGRRRGVSGRWRELGYLTALAQTDLSGELNYTDGNTLKSG